MADTETIRVEVVYALPDKQIILPVTLSAGATVADALAASRLDERVPGLDLASAKVGVFGKLAKRDQALRDGDQVEVYRPLIADPKAAKRKKKAADR
ncbi:MAG: hypothetical protein Kow006_27030 [Gammaproteobacteria bacterium]